jgi:hypothetical protein
MSSILSALRNLELRTRSISERSSDYPSDASKVLDALSRAVAALPIADKPVLLVPPKYKSLWERVKSGGSEVLSGRAVRFLCWDADVSFDPDFHRYLAEAGQLSSNAIIGLVRNLHRKWRGRGKNPEVLASIHKIVAVYEGPNRTLNLWRTESSQLLSDYSTDRIAAVLAEGKRPVVEVCSAWRLDINTEFASEAVLAASALCRNRWRRDSAYWTYWFEQLCSFPFPDVADLKRLIADTVKASETMHENWKEQLRTFILKHPNLGHPRLRVGNWAGVPQAVQDTVVRWCTAADIRLFFEYAMPAEGDKHGRRQFWLPFVSSVHQSRAILTESLRSDLKLRKINVATSGLTKSQHSAFILDFGQLVVVEFADVGACHGYLSHVFREMVPDIWMARPFDDSKLKNRERAAFWKKHSGEWEHSLRGFLAEHGIRPEITRQ